ncbi:phosphatidylinositol-specific phospholipase C/glycerophosphodiester phosphodiesterase family protein [Neobacillus sp. NPDC093182]|uniref:phosphatidylinositol-specific phospholipase C/glycerophosphodiester phosphodiesterase family protein n=1 Tax=Neobacillus sp. NPDC093182 TaxID=3364297 RepID=UPI0037F49D11
MKIKLVALSLIVAVMISFVNSFSAANAEADVAKREHVIPLSKAHAHNDYEHTRPLFDALDHGFTSVEADVWLVNGELLVAHDLEDVKPERTLKSLYLEPLKERIKSNQGSVYKGYKHEFHLWIDIKSEGVATYQAIHKELEEYQKMLTKFEGSKVKPGAITVFISGNRPRTVMESQLIRYAAYDGRMGDLDTGAPNTLIPVISDNWTKHFIWNGEGEMPQAEREKLKSIVSTAHADGQKVRFWATPDTPSPARDKLWKQLLDEGVDFINTDDLEGLEKFLKENDPKPSEPNITWKTDNKR